MPVYHELNGCLLHNVALRSCSFLSDVQAQLIDDALDLSFDGLRTNTKEHMRKVPCDDEIIV